MSAPYSFNNTVQVLSNNFAILFLLGLFFLGGFMVGSLWTENQFLKKGYTGTGGGSPTAAVSPAPAAVGDTGPTADQLLKAKKVSDSDHIQGNKNAKVVLIEYSDFECPFCSRFHPTMEKIKAEFGDQVAWVYRHYPLSFHPNAQKSSEAAECLVEQKGKDAFWQYATRMFAEQDKLGGKLNTDTALTVAKEFGINETQFNECLTSGKYAQFVTDSLNDGTAAGITGTPGTIILTQDGQAELIPGAVPYESAKAQIEKYL